MPLRLIAGIATILSAATLSFAMPPSASADTVNGCDLDVDPSTAVCMAFDSDHDGTVDPRVDVTWPKGPATAGVPYLVTITGTDLMRPITVGIHRTEYETTAQNMVASGTVGPGAMSATIPVVLDGYGPVHLRMMALDYTAEVYSWDDIEITLNATPTAMTSDLPPGRVVKVNTKSQVATGTVDGGARPVQIQVRAKDGAWVPVAQTTSAPDGSYSVPVPTSWVGKHTYRAFAPATGALGDAIGSATSTLKVKRDYKPQGSNRYALLGEKDARWNACAPIRYAVNTSRMPKWARSEYRRVFRDVTAATGLRFAYAGTTTHQYQIGYDENFPYEEFDVLLAWATPKQVRPLAGGVAGIGGSAYSEGVRFDGKAVFDASERNRPRAAWRAVIAHEVGHVIGLDHVNDSRLIMNPMSGRALRYGNGDLAGLNVLGAGEGACSGARPVQGWHRVAASSNQAATEPGYAMLP